MPKWVERRKRQTSPWDLPIRDERSGSGRCRATVPMWRKLMHLPAPLGRDQGLPDEAGTLRCRYRGLPTSPGPSHPLALLDARSHNLSPHLLCTRPVCSATFFSTCIIHSNPRRPFWPHPLFIAFSARISAIALIAAHSLRLRSFIQIHSIKDGFSLDVSMSP